MVGDVARRAGLAVAAKPVEQPQRNATPGIGHHLLGQIFVMHHGKLNQAGHGRAIDLAIHHRLAEAHLSIADQSGNSIH